MNKNIFVGAGAVFAMFFGSGNIVLPLQLGQSLGEDWFMSFVGFCVAGVLIPLSGLIASVLLNGDANDFFSPINKKVAIILQIIILSVNGPFGIVPRCESVAYGGIKGMSDNIPNYIFSAIFCMIVCALITRKEKIMPIISKILSPIKLTCLTVVVFLGCLMMPCSVIPTSFSAHSFMQGVTYGYLTMDLCGAIFFASMVLMYLKTSEKSNENNEANSQKKTIENGIKISLLSGALLSVVYLGFFMLSVGYRDHTAGISGEDLLPSIIQIALGSFSKYLICTTVTVACITTAVAYLSIWIFFVSNLLKNVCFFSYNRCVYIGAFITYVVSLLGFQKIINLMMPIVNIIYPFLIALTIYNIVRALSAQKEKAEDICL